MGKAALTDKQLKFMKAGSTRKELPCGPPAGLYAIIQPSGGKSFALRYRWQGAPRKVTFGSYPKISLAAARAEAEAARAALESGIDPAEAKAEEEGRKPESFRAVAEEWLQRKVTETKTFTEVNRIVHKEIIPVWKHQLVTEITKPDVLRLLDAIVDRGAPVLGNRTRSILLRLFGWCIERGYVEHSPVAGIRPLAKEETRDRVLSDAELAHVWQSAGEIGFPFGPYLQFLTLTAQRRGEVANMKWGNVDLEKKLWTLPKEAVKAGRIHDVPLSGAALDILKSLPRFEGPFAFSSTSGKRPISGFSKMKVSLDGEKPLITNWRVHDLRRTAATAMAKAGVAPHVLGAILNHSAGKVQGITAVYNRFRYVEERRAALEQWGQHVVNLAAGQKSKVAHLVGA